MKQNTLRLVWFALIFLLVAWLNFSLFRYAEDEALVDSDALDDCVTLREKIFTREDMHVSGSREIWGSRGLNIHIRRDLYEKSG